MLKVAKCIQLIIYWESNAFWTVLVLKTFHSVSSLPCNLIRNITSHSLKNLAFQRLLRWKVLVMLLYLCHILVSTPYGCVLNICDYTTNSDATLLIHFLIKPLGECTLWAHSLWFSSCLVINFSPVQTVPNDVQIRSWWAESISCWTTTDELYSSTGMFARFSQYLILLLSHFSLYTVQLCVVHMWCNPTCFFIQSWAKRISFENDSAVMMFDVGGMHWKGRG